MAKVKIPRSRIVTIAKIYDKPKLLSEQEDYNYYGFGIKLEDGTYANISVSATDEDQAVEKAQKKLTLEDGNPVEEGETYEVFEESSDAEHKYWNVVAFVPAKKSKIDYTGSINSTPNPYEGMTGSELAKVQAEVDNRVGGQKPLPTSVPIAQSNFREAEERKQLMIVRQSAINYATQLAGIYYAWHLKENPTANLTMDDMSSRIKEIAKDYEKQIMGK